MIKVLQTAKFPLEICKGTYEERIALAKDFNKKFFNEISQKFLKEERLFSPLCASCEFEQICHGNCRRMCNTYYDEKYCGYQDFLRYASPTISRIAFQFRR